MRASCCCRGWASARIILRRVSLANLNESDYRKIVRAIRKLTEEYVERYKKETGKSFQRKEVK
ncbi:aspartate 4-decarboxylase [Paraburkholderia hospita]|jgi:aspartate 4-decarboxylase|nr:aspartate 4-decarboxylase [Paraburkholderia hospita]